MLTNKYHCFVVCQFKKGGAGNKFQTDRYLGRIASYTIVIQQLQSHCGKLQSFSFCSPIYSDKTDIFDFAVILLEVVSGKTITSMYEVDILKELVCVISSSMLTLSF
jgi:hypothetical protein